MKKETNSRSHQKMLRLIDVALKTYYRVEHIQQHKTQQICSVEPVKSPKPVEQNTPYTPCVSLLIVILLSTLVQVFPKFIRFLKKISRK